MEKNLKLSLVHFAKKKKKKITKKKIKKKKKKKMQWGQEKITKTNKHEFNPEQNKPKLTKQIKQLKQ